MKILTNSDVKKPYNCEEMPYDYLVFDGNFPSGPGGTPPPSVEVDVVE